MQIFVNTNFDFVRWRLHALVLSLLVIGFGAFLFFTKGPNLGIDFSGGANIVLRFTSTPPIAELRSGLPSATIQQYGPAEENSILIRLPQQAEEGDYAGEIVSSLHGELNPQGGERLDLNYHGSERLASVLQQADPDNRGTNPAAVQHYQTLANRIIERRSELGVFTSMAQVTGVPGVSAAAAGVLNEQAYIGSFNLLSQETVGPQVGAELQAKGMWAVILASLAMGIYIAIRFEGGLVFGTSALVCIIHDVLIALTFMLLMNLEFSLNVVAALLTLIGYSINDTVVMYDRVRENRRRIKQSMTIAEHLNKAINDTLSRTVLTSATVLVVLVSLLLFGGEVIRSFAWILTIGVVSGTYSTLFIVPAFVVAWDNWRNRNRPAAAAAAVPASGSRDEAATRKRKAS